MKIIITGGAGFIGSNAVAHYCTEGNDVMVIDNLSRASSKINLSFLRKSHDFVFLRADLADSRHFSEAFQNFGPDVVLHLAGQVAVTTSVADPRLDFAGNLLGTFNLLEECRAMAKSPFFIYASTNKVYGDLDHMSVIEGPSRYAYGEGGVSVSETFPLNFHSPYGCSKGAADQYVLEYCRSFGVPSVVFRQSCIYGPGQFGIEDQGWVAWFVAASMLNRPVMVFGDGKQVRDVLHVDDLLRAYDLAISERDMIAGHALNIGGGPDLTLSVLELISAVESLSGSRLDWSFGPWRPSDQRVYISDISKARAALGWRPSIEILDGLDGLYSWVRDNLESVEAVLR